MIVSKLRKPLTIQTKFAPYAPYVSRAQISFQGYIQPSGYDSSFDFTQPVLNVNQIEISQVYIDSIPYDLVSSEALCLATEQTAYFDFDAQFIYVHAIHTTRIASSQFDGQKTVGYCSDDVFYDSNGVEFLPYQKNAQNIEESADRLVYDKMSFESTTLKYNNSDGEFDQYIENPTPGSDVNILYISTDDLLIGKNTLVPIYTGYVESDDITLDSYTVGMVDKREHLNVSVPEILFDVVSYPDAEDKVIGTVIPEGYGNLIGIPAICTNGTIKSGDVTYKYATDGTTLGTVYAEVDKEWVSVVPTALDPVTCTFTLSSGDGRQSNGKALKVKVNARLRDLDSPGDILVDMILRYLNKRYTTDYFDIPQWDAEAAYLADIYFYMDETKELFEYIECMQNASDYGFKLRVNAEGKFTLKVDNIHRVISRTIMEIDNISQTRPGTRDFTQYATSVRVNYGFDITDKTSSYTINTDYKDATFDEYRVVKSLKYDSCLISQSDAENKAVRIALDYSKARDQLVCIENCIIPTEVYDVICINTSLYDDDNNVIREYYGTRIIKVSSVSYDFEAEQTKIMGYDISDVNPAVLVRYDQGFAAGEYASGNFMAGSTTV